MHDSKALVLLAEEEAAAAAAAVELRLDTHTQ
jgi:hypothetical protein